MRLTMPLTLVIMAALGVVVSSAGWPLLTAPAAVRRRFGWRATPQSVYILRLVGAMLTTLGLILLVFAASYWRATI